MAINLYDTNTLNATVDSLKRTPAFFLNNFFRQIEPSDTEEIFFDVEIDGKKRRLAPFVHPLKEGKIVESEGFSTKSFKPAYVKDKRVHDPLRPFKREIGETIGTGQNLTPQQRLQAALARDLRDQVDILTRRKEVMAAEVLRTGQCTVKGEGFGTVVVDFGRDNNLTISHGNGERWGDNGVKPLDELKEWSMYVLQKSGARITDIVMDHNTWPVFYAAADMANKLDNRRADPRMALDSLVIPDHVQYMGTDGVYRYWIYTDWYIDPDTGTETPMLPYGTVLGLSQQMMGVQHHGAIRDIEAIEGGSVQREYYVKSWTEKDPSSRILLMQSAPLVVPYRVNAMWAATVIAE